MRILVLGAGGTGGYFGGRLHQAGRDVTFLVRPRRAEQLRANGLAIRSALGDADLPVQFVTEVEQRYDVVLLSNKSYDLETTMEAVGPAVGERTLIVPLLNGMRHLDALDARFGAERVLGGYCVISASLDADGTVRHLMEKMRSMHFGDRAGGVSERVKRAEAALQAPLMESVASREILQEMWEKWFRLAALAGATCLMRASVGTIVGVSGGEDFMLGLLDECTAVAGACGHAVRAEAYDGARATLTRRGSSFTASMLRDVEAGGRVEAEHVLGDLFERGRGQGLALPLLGLALCHLRAYESRLNPAG